MKYFQRALKVLVRATAVCMAMVLRVCVPDMPSLTHLLTIVEFITTTTTTLMCDLQVDRNFLSAWTLLGHEFIELRQHEAAIEAYRQAVDVRDRRSTHARTHAASSLPPPS